MGGVSIEMARSMGMTVLCDHSIVHPRLLAGLVDGTGGLTPNLGALWSRVEDDIEKADGLIVNSEFVASTCRAAGVGEKPIYVASTGVKPALLRSMDEVTTPDRWGKVRALFAGTLERRKGVDTLVAAIAGLSPAAAEWTLIGPWEPDVAELAKSLPANVVHRDTVPHHQLAVAMATANLFVFPSRAEGSARVVAEALVSGCYVITTPNAGSIVRDGIDGRIVQPGDHHKLAQAVEEYASMLPSERQTRSQETMRFARQRLSEVEYTSSVMNAYGE
jgi:glycosyltransferase involved in cell wall biosynthesis